MPSSSLLCQECNIHPSKYECPRCSLKTCSLKCCQKHKARMNCSGKRDRTQFIPMAQMNDTTIQNDYHFLEDISSSISGGKRLLQHVVGSNSSKVSNKRGGAADHQQTEEEETPKQHPILVSSSDDLAKRQNDNNTDTAALTTDEPYHTKKRHKKYNIVAAQDRGVTVLTMPTTMERHKLNTTYYNHNNQTIYWKVEFCVHSSTTSATTIKAKTIISEQSTIMDAWKEVLQSSKDADSTTTTKLSSFVQQDLHFLLKRLPCPANRPSFMEINPNNTFRMALKNTTIIEFPTIHVVSTDQLPNFPLLLQEIK